MIYPSVVEQLKRNAHIHSDSAAYLDRSLTLTWRETYERVRAMACLLQKMGVRGGARVAILLANTVDSVVILHAVWWMGATGVMVNSNIEFSVILEQLTTAEATVLLYDPAHSDLARKVASKTGLLAIGDPQRSPPAPVEAAFVEANGADFALVSFTSGTTGTPKGTVITYSSLSVRGGSYAVAGGLCHKDRGLITTPMCMAGSLNLALLPYLYSAASCVLTDQTHGESVVGLIEAHRVTTLFTVPLISRRIALAATPQRLSSLRFILSSGAELPSALLDDLVALGIDVHEAAGTSESAGGIYMTQTQRPNKPRSVGVAMPSCSVEIRDRSTGKRLPDGVSGEMVIAGPLISYGYLQVGKGVEPFPVDGTWSGDIAHRDADGFFYIVGRLKDTIVTGGQNVHPVDVEEALRGMSDVRDVVVLGCPDPDWGEAVSAVIVPANPALTAGGVMAFARARLAPYQVPKQVVFVQELPHTSMGKVDRRALKATCAGIQRDLRIRRVEK